MIKRKSGPRILIIAFVVIICFSWLWWILLEKYVDSTNYENREMALRPQLTIDNYDTFAGEYEEYFNDNLPFRNNLISINAARDYFVFNKSTNSRVIVGEDEWLFYADEEGGDPISCYQGTNLFTEEELQRIAQNFVNAKEFLEKQGKEFVVLILPNKERIYSEYMPRKYGEPAETYRALQVVEYLRSNTDVRVVYPYDELMEAKKSLSQNIYFKTDTHWNWIGSYIGAVALLTELGVDMPEITDEEIKFVADDTMAGDLAGMLNLKNVLKNIDAVYTVEGYDDHNAKEIENDFYDAVIYHAENADPRKIYICRDSFTLHMAKYIGSQFCDSYMKHRSKYSYENFLQQDPDIFVYETVERYVDQMLEFSIK